MNLKKLNSRVEMMFNNCEIDDDLLSTQLNKENVKKLLDYQIIHTINLITAIKKNDAILDGSSTGTGKTYTSICLCKELNLRPLIICPKSIISVWKSVCDFFGVLPLAVINYETIRNGRTNKKKKKLTSKSKSNSITTNKLSTFFEIDDNEEQNINIDIEEDDDIKLDVEYVKLNDNNDYAWDLPKNSIVIIDEAHKCKNEKTLNGKMLLSLKNKTKIMLLSATIADKPANFKVFGYILGFYNDIKKNRAWIESIIREDNNKLNSKTSSLHEKIYPLKGSRMSLDDIKTNVNVKNQVTVDCYNLSDKIRKEINIQYDQIKQLYKTNKLSQIIKCRQKIELCKIPIIIDQIEKYIDNEKSVVVFVNFVETFERICDYLSINKIDHAKVRGNQEIMERDTEINKFQTNMVRVVICMMQVGGQSINLDDTHGNYPRVSLISPSFSSIDLIQALGRIDRAGTKSAILQKIILCNDTYENLIVDKIKAKLKFNQKLGENDKNNQANNKLINLLDQENDLY